MGAWRNGLSGSNYHTVMKIDIEIQNFKEVADRFKQRAKEIKPAIQRIVSLVSLNVERFGKLYSPVKTGRMRASIYPVDINELSARVGPKVEYAKFVHARIPFMFAARQDTMPTVAGIIKKEINKAIR